ncbi:MAG: hypothetical protein Q9184_001374 [Pyrenodesmia sp. 2 TL-2023]
MSLKLGVPISQLGMMSLRVCMMYRMAATVPRIGVGMTVAQPVRRACSSRPAFRRLQCHCTYQEPTTEDTAFIIGTALSYFCLAIGITGYTAYENFKQWKALDQKFKEDTHSQFSDLKKYDIKKVQAAVQKIDPHFQPGKAAKKARLAEDKLKDLLYTATSKVPKRVPVPDAHSEDAVERVAAMCLDKEKKDHFRKIWDRSSLLFDNDKGENLREGLEAWGLEVPKTGNPFGDGGKGFWWFW